PALVSKERYICTYVSVKKNPGFLLASRDSSVTIHTELQTQWLCVASPPMAISAWPTRWDALRGACDYRNATGRWAKGAGKPPRFDIGPPATEREVGRLEATLGCTIPPSLRKVFLEYSAATCIEWALPEGAVMPESFRQIWSGECRWDLASLPELLET